MKGQAKRFLDHKGVLFKTSPKKKESDGDVGFFDLWRYSSSGERLATALGVAAALASASALVLAVTLYGELTSLFVVRHKAARAPGRTPILNLFGGGRIVPEGDRPLHMDALVEDSVAFAVASVAVMAMQITAAASAVTLANWAARRMTTRLRWRLLRAVLSQEVAFFDTNTSMNFAAALTEDMEKLRSGVGEHVAMTAHLAGSVAMCAGAALAAGWQLTLAGLAVVPFSVLVSAVVSKYQTRWSSAEVRASGSAARVVEQALANVRTVRAYAGEQLELNRYSEALAPAAAASKRRGVWSGAGAGLGWLLTYTLNAAVFAYGAELCARDMPLPPEEREYDPGVLVTVLFLTFMASQNITLCSPHLEMFSAARGAASGLFQLLERRPRIDALSEEGQRPEQFRGDIEFDNVYFNYPSRPDVKVLRGLSLKVRAGETVALVGGSGSGKSTLLQLLQRLYEPDSGSVSVDGQRLQRLDLHHYRRSIGVVGQEPVLFSGSIRDNIALGVEATHEEVVAAAQLAHAHQFISKLANGYDTVLGFGGASLSGGQKQRVAIARAVLRRPRLLLLDEPTSALDPAAERLVQAALDNASQGRTTIVVSHRLSTIVNASRIVYMEQGAALEQGSHQELIARRGLYWRLLQEDMASRSIPATLASTGEDEAEDEAEAEDETEMQASLPRADLRRSFSRQSTCRASLRMSSAFAHVPAVAAHEEPIHAEEVEGGEQKEPEASSLALLKLNAPEWPLLAGGGAAAFVVGASMPLFALLFAKLYGMFAESDPEVILHQSRVYALAFLGVAGACGLASWLQAWLLNAAGARLTRRLREDCFQNYLQQEQGWFDEPQNSVGALCARLATDCAAVQGATGSRLGAALQAGSTVVVGTALALPHSWQMTLVSLLSVPAVIGAIYAEGYATRRAEMAERRALEQASRLATEAVINVRTVQSLGVEAAILSRYRVSLQEANARAQRTLWARGPAYGLCLCAPTLGYAISLAYGGWLVARQGLHFESAILVSEALIYGAWMLAEALSFAPSFAAARRSGSRILAALRREPNIVTEDTATDDPRWSATGAVEFSGVNFSYPTRRNAPVLRGLNLRLEPGHTVALVGASGCGKSTLLQLLLRSYDPEQGHVSLDGRDIRRSLPLPQLRAQLGLVQQEPVLFERTLRENIAYGDNGREVSLDEVVEAAKQANIHGFISSLPLGYETRLGYGGASLSGGQKQRVAIARALLRRPRVLLLDEATSALDAASEKTVQAALEAASLGRTTLVIAHRLATVRHAHRICVVDKGVIAESGSHEELVRKRGLYWQLLQQQEPAADA